MGKGIIAIAIVTIVIMIMTAGAIPPPSIGLTIIVACIVVGIGRLVGGKKTEKTKKCPYCANDIKFEAIMCQYCGQQLNNSTLNNSQKHSYSNNIIETQIGSMYTAITETRIRSDPNHDASIIKTLNVGETVYFQQFNNDDPKWFLAETTDSINGWCFGPHFR